VIFYARCAVQALLWRGLLVCRRRLLRVNGGVCTVLEAMTVRLQRPGVMIFNARCVVHAVLWRGLLVSCRCLLRVSGGVCAVLQVVAAQRPLFHWGVYPTNTSLCMAPRSY
jgi:hypothetical protein